MSETTSGQEIPQPQWEEESYYFGNATTPSWAIYRRSGERVQRQEEVGLHLIPKPNSKGQYLAQDERVKTFLETYEDCAFIVADSHEIRGTDGKRTTPVLWVIGWQELTTEEDWHWYENDKRIGM